MDETAPTVPETDFAARSRVETATAPTVPPFTPPPYTPSVPAGRRGMGWRMGVALGLIAFLIGVGATAFFVTRFGKDGDGKQVATMTLPVSNGQPPVVILPGKPGAPVPAIDLAALTGREEQLAAKLAELEARETGIDQDAQQSAAYATRSEGLMVAFAARRALDRGLNLGFLEQQLRKRFGTSQAAAVASITQAARNPVTLEDLRAGLDGVTPELMTGVGSSGWLQSLGREIRNLVVLRRAGTPSPLPIDRIARARRLLEAGQVEAALAEVSRMPGASQATRWTEAARRYIGARHALDTIESAAINAPGVEPKASVPTTIAPPASAPAQPEAAEAGTSPAV
ncbi:hypothetical protein [Sphingomonas sp. PAMC 26617]|uniref:hypothetical protein n=1 Tax=Sphingomonas sp. PAMC 26617 TaxID=1112216 RepID=UPI001E62DC84|nr:hypothetical protein [Sphingomonas sp. PAMC 26617]